GSQCRLSLFSGRLCELEQKQKLPACNSASAGVPRHQDRFKRGVYFAILRGKTGGCIDDDRHWSPRRRRSGLFAADGANEQHPSKRCTMSATAECEDHVPLLAEAARFGQIFQLDGNSGWRRLRWERSRRRHTFPPYWSG